jgi:polyisoprenoid-binding protein YceI
MNFKSCSRAAAVFGLSLIGFASAASAALYNIDGSHSDVGFKIKHLMLSNVKGHFNKVDGSFEYDEKTKTLTKVMVKIETASIDTHEKKRDEHLQSADFFDAVKHPTIEFTADKATGVEPKKSFKLAGKLKMHGVEKPVTLDVEFSGTTTDPYGNDRIVFSAAGKIKRSDFGLSWNKNLDKGGVVLGEDVNLEIESESVKAK